MKHDIHRAAGVLAWLAATVALGSLLARFATGLAGPHPWVLHPTGVHETSLWAHELAFEPGSGDRIDVVLASGTVLHVIGRPAGPGPARLMRVSTHPRIPSGFYRIEPGDTALHPERLARDEADSRSGDPSLGGWLFLDLETLAARFPELERWSLFSLVADATGTGRRALGSKDDLRSTRNLALALAVLLVAAGLGWDRTRGGDVAELARALRLALWLPGWIVALASLEPLAPRAQAIGAVAATACLWLVVFAPRVATVRLATVVGSVLAAAALAWGLDRALAPPVSGSDRASQLEALADRTASAAPRDVVVLCIGEANGEVPGAQRWEDGITAYPARLARILDERAAAAGQTTVHRAIDLRGRLDLRNAAALDRVLQRVRPDVVVMETAAERVRGAWLPPALREPFAWWLARAPGRARGLDRAERVEEAVRRVRDGGSTALLLVPPSFAAYLARERPEPVALGSAPARAVGAERAREAGAIVVDVNAPAVPFETSLVPPFLDESGRLNEWGRELVAQALANAIREVVAGGSTRLFKPPAPAEVNSAGAPPPTRLASFARRPENRVPRRSSTADLLRHLGQR